MWILRYIKYNNIIINITLLLYGKGTYTENETGWWQEETRKAVVLKSATLKEFQMTISEENKDHFRETNRASRKADRIAQMLQSRNISK